MPTFARKPLNPHPFLRYIRRHPFLLFGAPFCTLVVASSLVMTPFAQTRYDLHDSKVKTKGFEESMGISHDRKKIDLREEYFRLSNPGWQPESNADGLALSAAEDPAVEEGITTPKNSKKKKFSMTPVNQEKLENVRVPRPDGMPEWGPPRDTTGDAPLKGHRREDRWV